MIDVSATIKRASEKAGFNRTKYNEENIPTSISNVIAMPFFGDLRSTFTLSSLLLHRIKTQLHGSKYFIFCSWPGNEALFPYVDEYWAIKDEAVLKNLYHSSKGFTNDSNTAVTFQRNLNHFFEDVIDSDAIRPFYERGFKQDFFNTFRHIKRFLPSVPSSAILGPEFSRALGNRKGFKVFVHPVLEIEWWRNGQYQWVKTPKEFWVTLVKRLVDEGFCPIVYRNFFTHDISGDFVDSCLYVSEKDIGKVMAVMRASDCVLDVFSGISRLAMAARCPYVVCDERLRSNALKDYEIEDLCAKNIPKEFIYAFSTIIDYKDAVTWNLNLFDLVVKKLGEIITDVDRNKLPATSESYEIIPYANVREVSIKKVCSKIIRRTSCV